jgi:hypothetical protein
MSHYFYNSAFDFVSSDGNFGYYIEESNIKDSYGIMTDEYVIEVHYLGDIASTLSIDVSGISGSNLDNIYYVEKGFNNSLRSDPDGQVQYSINASVGSPTSDTSSIINQGGTSWSLEQGSQDPAFGLIEFKIPTTSTQAVQVAANGQFRPHDYLLLEAGLYYDIIQEDASLVTSLQNLIDDVAGYTLTDFASDLNSATNTLTHSLFDSTGVGIVDASNDITYDTYMGGVYVLNEAPNMIHFDNINYYSYDDFDSPVQLNTGADISPSETTLIGEFRIDETDGTDGMWSFDVDMQVYMNTNVLPNYSPVNVLEEGATSPVDINLRFINDTGDNTNVSNVKASISRDADGMLTITDIDDGTNTITEGYIIDTMPENSTYQHSGGLIGDKHLDVGLYVVSYHPDGGPNDTGVVYMDQVVQEYNTGGHDFYSISSGKMFSEQSEKANYDTLVNGINDATYAIGSPVKMLFDDLSTSPFTISIDPTSTSYYYDVSGTSSAQKLDNGNYLVNVSGSSDIKFTKIGPDTDFDGIAELLTEEYSLYIDITTEHNQLSQFAYDINSKLPLLPTTPITYERADEVILKMDELGQTWNSVDITGGSYMAEDGTSISNGIYKVSLDSGHIYLQATTALANNEYDIDKGIAPYQLSNASQTAFESAINMGTAGGSVTDKDLNYKQYFYDLINTNPADIVDGDEVIEFMDQFVLANGGTSYKDAQSFDNTGMNSINTAVMNTEGVSSVDAGAGNDLIVGGLGGFTIHGGSGLDLFMASNADILIGKDQADNVISEDGIIVDLTAKKVYYLESNTNDVVHDVEFFMGSLGDDKFVGSLLYGSPADTGHNNIQVFNPTKGKDEIFGAETDINPNTNEVIEVLTAVDYDGMQGGQGVIFILDNSDAANYANAGQGEISYAKIAEYSGEYWNDTSWAGDGWLPSNEDIVNDGNFSTVSRYVDRQDATLILDSFGDTDLAFDVDHYIGSGDADIFFGSSGNDSFDAATGTGNFMSGGSGNDRLVITDLNEKVLDDNGTPTNLADDIIKDASDNIDLDSLNIDRNYNHIHFQDVKVDTGTTELVTDTSSTVPGNAALYRIDFADVSDLSAFYLDNLSSTIPHYNVSNEYQLFLRTSTADLSTTISNLTDFTFDSTNNKIDVAGTDLSKLSNLTGQLVIAEEIVDGFTITGVENDGRQYSTVIEDVEQVAIISDDGLFFGTGQISGPQEDTYKLITGGQGDIGDMLYVETGQTLDTTTGVGSYTAGSNFLKGDIFYSGHHTDFERNTSNPNIWANSVAIAYKDTATIWNDEVAQFFVWYDVDETDSIDGYEIAVKYQNAGINSWGIDNRQFDTFQNVNVDQSLADAIKLQFGANVPVELGEYRVLYEAAFTDIETLIGSHADVNQWNFDFQPTSSRSTFYIQVGGDATGENGSAGISDTLVTNVKVERVDDGVGFKWFVNPEAEILVNLPILAGADETDNLMISGNAAQTIEAGTGADVMMGRGGSDNYKINAGDTLAADGTAATGSYGVAGDVINEIGGSSLDKSDAITLSSAKNIDELSFTRTEIANEYWGNTLKIDVTYNEGGGTDTLYVFDHYNQSQGFRAVEQLFLDDGWDADEIWNLIVGDMNETSKIDEYEGTDGQDVLIAGTKVSNLYGGDGQDIMIGDVYSKVTTFELGNRDDAWDKAADIIEGFGVGDKLDLTALGIADVSEITANVNELKFTADNAVIAEFRNFNDGLTLQNLLDESGYIEYGAA